MKPLLIFSSAFSVLFGLHIAFAANDLDLMFQIVAVMLVVLTFFCGHVLEFINGRLNHPLSGQYRLGYILSLPLSAGIAYAYAGMAFRLELILVTTALTTLTHGAWSFFVQPK